MMKFNMYDFVGLIEVPVIELLRKQRCKFTSDETMRSAM